jgi:hypothetical protein
MNGDSSDTSMTPLERLIAIEEIKRLKAKYWRGIDTEDWPLFGSLFTENLTVDFREAIKQETSDTEFPQKFRGEVIRGRANFLDIVKKGRAARNSVGSISMHHGHLPEIDILSPTSARGIWAMEDMVFWPGKKTTHGYGYYHETYEKVDGHWKISSIRLQRLRVGPLE